MQPNSNDHETLNSVFSTAACILPFDKYLWEIPFWDTQPYPITKRQMGHSSWYDLYGFPYFTLLYGFDIPSGTTDMRQKGKLNTIMIETNQLSREYIFEG